MYLTLCMHGHNMKLFQQFGKCQYWVVFRFEPSQANLETYRAFHIVQGYVMHILYIIHTYILFVAFRIARFLLLSFLFHVCGLANPKLKGQKKNLENYTAMQSLSLRILFHFIFFSTILSYGNREHV